LRRGPDALLELLPVVFVLALSVALAGTISNRKVGRAILLIVVPVSALVYVTRDGSGGTSNAEDANGCRAAS
jgi:hypothetical protein